MVKETEYSKKNGPLRTCLGCHKCDLKKKLLRLVFCNGQLLLDKKQSYQARGSYVHNNEKCLGKVRNFSLWEHSLKLSAGSISNKEWPKEFFSDQQVLMGKKRGIRL